MRGGGNEGGWSSLAPMHEERGGKQREVDENESKLRSGSKRLLDREVIKKWLSSRFGGPVIFNFFASCRLAYAP